MNGYDGDDFNSGRNGNLATSYGNDDGTRNFLAGANPVFTFGLYEGFTDPLQPYSGLTSVNPPRRGMESLDLNGSTGWADMEAYEGILRSGPEGSHKALTPMRVPPRRNLNLQPPRSTGNGGAGKGTGGRATSEAVGGAHVPPLPRPHALHQPPLVDPGDAVDVVAGLP
jgi:hypothetical protein